MWRICLGVPLLLTLGCSTNKEEQGQRTQAVIAIDATTSDPTDANERIDAAGINTNEALVAPIPTTEAPAVLPPELPPLQKIVKYDLIGVTSVAHIRVDAASSRMIDQYHMVTDLKSSILSTVWGESPPSVLTIPGGILDGQPNRYPDFPIVEGGQFFVAFAVHDHDPDGWRVFHLIASDKTGATLIGGNESTAIDELSSVILALRGTP